MRNRIKKIKTYKYSSLLIISLLIMIGFSLSVSGVNAKDSDITAAKKTYEKCVDEHKYDKRPEMLCGKERTKYNELLEKEKEKEKEQMKKNANDSENSWWFSSDSSSFVCGGIMSQELFNILKQVYQTISLVMVVALIIFGMLDFIKATSSDDEGALKKAQNKFIKRFIVVVILIMLPILLDLILTLFGDANMKNCLSEIK